MATLWHVAFRLPTILMLMLMLLLVFNLAVWQCCCSLQEPFFIQSGPSWWAFERASSLTHDILRQYRTTFSSIRSQFRICGLLVGGGGYSKLVGSFRNLGRNWQFSSVAAPRSYCVWSDTFRFLRQSRTRLSICRSLGCVGYPSVGIGAESFTT